MINQPDSSVPDISHSSQALTGRQARSSTAMGQSQHKQGRSRLGGCHYLVYVVRCSRDSAHSRGPYTCHWADGWLVVLRWAIDSTDSILRADLGAKPSSLIRPPPHPDP